MRKFVPVIEKLLRVNYLSIEKPPARETFHSIEKLPARKSICLHATNIAGLLPYTISVDI